MVRKNVADCLNLPHIRQTNHSSQIHAHNNLILCSDVSYTDDL
jgi:hypothetical protein